MKVILTQDVYKKGVAGEVVNVAPGYARNYLIPQGMAVKASAGALQQLQNLRGRAEVRRAERDQEYGQIAEKIHELKLFFSVKAGETGKLYGSVTSATIAEALKDEIGLDIDRRRIGDRPLRELGEFAVPVRLEAGLNPTVQVVVFREGADPREMEVEAIEEEAGEFAEDESEESFEAAEEEVEELETEELEAEELETEELEEALDEEATSDDL